MQAGAFGGSRQAVQQALAGEDLQRRLGEIQAVGQQQAFEQAQQQFERDKGSIDPKRLSNHYHHVCPTCDPKRFAQKKGVEKRKKLNLPADGLITIDEL